MSKEDTATATSTSTPPVDEPCIAHINNEFLEQIAFKLDVVKNKHVPVVEKLMKDVTYPIYDFRVMINEFSGHFISGSRYEVIRSWHYLVKHYLEGMNIKIDYHDTEEFDYDDSDSEITQYICPVEKEIATDWWITDAGDSITGNTLKGIAKSGRTPLHPITRRKIRFAFLNREKMLNMKKWAEINYPDLNDYYNDRYIHIPDVPCCAIYCKNNSNRYTYDTPTGFYNIDKLLLKGRANQLPLSVLIDNRMNHEFINMPALPILIPVDTISNTEDIEADPDTVNADMSESVIDEPITTTINHNSDGTTVRQTSYEFTRVPESIRQAMSNVFRDLL